VPIKRKQRARRHDEAPKREGIDSTFKPPKHESLSLAHAPLQNRARPRELPARSSHINKSCKSSSQCLAFLAENCPSVQAPYVGAPRRYVRSSSPSHAARHARQSASRFGSSGTHSSEGPGSTAQALRAASRRPPAERASSAERAKNGGAVRGAPAGDQGGHPQRLEPPPITASVAITPG
jgi:hypothetical protein